MDVVAGSKNDEYYTPAYAIEPIKKYLTDKKTIWCPFDTKDSLFVKELQREGHNVIATHISSGGDFFDLDIDCDAVVSNPPYSLKTEVFEKLFKSGKPFAMLVGVVGLFESERRFKMFSENDFEIMYLNKRVDFFKDYNDPKPSVAPPFSSVYLCSKLLPKQIVFERINKVKFKNNAK